MATNRGGNSYPSPDVLRIVRQDGVSTDCAVASLAHFLGVSYAEALAAFPRPDRVVRAGAYMTEIVTAALAFGVKTKLRKRYDLDEDTGILHVSGADEHLVYLWAGRIIEGNGECYLSAHDYMRINKYKPQSLLQRVG